MAEAAFAEQAHALWLDRIAKGFSRGWYFRSYDSIENRI